MFGGKAVAGLAGFVLLAACGGKVEDDATNIPRLGNWNSKVVLESVSRDGERFEGAKIPKDVADTLGGLSKYSELGCTEPKLASVEALNDKMPPNLAKMCKLTPGEGDPASFSFASECDASNLPEGVTGMKFTGQAEVAPDKVDMTFNVDVTAKGPDGAEEVTNIVQKRSFWRVGECPA